MSSKRWGKTWRKKPSENIRWPRLAGPRLTCSRVASVKRRTALTHRFVGDCDLMITVRMFHSCFRVKIITEPDIVQEKYFLGRFQLIKDKLIYLCANENIYYKNCISSIEPQMYYNGQLISSYWLLCHSKQDHLVKGSSLSRGLCTNGCLFLFVTWWLLHSYMTGLTFLVLSNIKNC